LYDISQKITCGWAGGYPSYPPYAQYGPATILPTGLPSLIPTYMPTPFPIASLTESPSKAPTGAPTSTPTEFEFDAPAFMYVEASDCTFDQHVSWDLPSNYNGNENKLWGFKLELCDRIDNSPDKCAFRYYPLAEVHDGGFNLPEVILCSDEILDIANPAAPNKPYNTVGVQYWYGNELPYLNCNPQQVKLSGQESANEEKNTS